MKNRHRLLVPLLGLLTFLSFPTSARWAREKTLELPPSKVLVKTCDNSLALVSGTIRDTQDPDPAIPMDGITTVGQLRQYCRPTPRRLMDTLSALRKRKETDRAGECQYQEHLKEKLSLIIAALGQCGVTVDPLDIDATEDCTPLGVKNAEVTSAHGLKTTTFEIAQGTIRVYVPDDIMAGDTISGTVIAEPKGRNAEERTRNMSSMADQKINIAAAMAPDGTLDVNVDIPIATTASAFTFKLPQGGALNPTYTNVNSGWSGILKISLINRSGALSTGSTQTISVEIAPLRLQSIAPLTTVQLPAIGQQGRPFEIIGPSDGNIGNTRLMYGPVGSSLQDFEKNTENVSGGFGLISPVAKSPRRIVFRVPSDISGPVQLYLKEGNRQTLGLSHFVRVGLRGKTNLARNERTDLTIEVSGLLRIDIPVPMTLEAQGVIRMDGGNFQQFTIQPSQVGLDGRYTTTRGITGLQTGGWEATATVVTQSYNFDQRDPNLVAQQSATTTASHIGGAGTPTIKVDRAKAYLAAKKVWAAQNPVPFDLGPVSGFADYHIHQFTQEAYDGRLYYGGYEGPEETALRRCSGIKHGLAYPFIKSITFYTKFFGKESPFYDWTPHDAATKGYANGNFDYRDWPTWRTYSHVQYWEGWMKQAKDSGLSLVVMSATNSRFLCGVLPPNNSGALQDFSLRDPLTQIKFSGPSACGDMKNMLRQIRVALDFASRNSSWYEVALTPGQARRIIHQGKLAVVLAMEGSEMFLNAATPADVEAQLQAVYDVGVRSIQPVHHTDNQFAGAAQFKNELKTMNDYWAFKNQIIAATNPTGLNLGEINNTSNDWTTAITARKLDSEGRNLLGMRPLGKELLKMMIRRHMLIDGAHLSERAFADAYSVVKEADWYPIYNSHARLRRLYPDCMFQGAGDPKKCTTETANEMAISDDQIKMIKETGGVVGLRTGPEPRFTYRPAGIANNCHGSTRSWLQEYFLAVTGYGLTPGFATDMQGGAVQLRPRFYDRKSTWQNTLDNQSFSHWACGGHGSNETVKDNQKAQGDRGSNGTGTNFDLVGLGHIGYLGALVQDVQNILGGYKPWQLNASAEAYLAMWDRTYAVRSPLSTQIFVSDSNIDTNSLADDKCPWPHEKLASPSLIKGRTVCLSKPDTTIQRHNCFEGDHWLWSSDICVVEEKEYHVRVRRVVEDICPNLTHKLKGQDNAGRIVCRSVADPGIQAHNCAEQGKQVWASPWGKYCLMGESGWYVNVKNLKEDLCPNLTNKLEGQTNAGRIVCRSVADPGIQAHNCAAQGKQVWASPWATYCLMEQSAWHVNVKNLKEDICPGIRDKAGTSSGRIMCKDIPSFTIKRKKCNSVSQDGNHCLMQNNGYWYLVRRISN